MSLISPQWASIRQTAVNDLDAKTRTIKLGEREGCCIRPTPS